jgi:DNA-binding LytR/AlgR family response regulator
MEKQFKCCLIDDEPIARRVIKTYLAPMQDYKVIQECGDAFEALQFLKKQQLDLLFLDIKMPGLSGLDFLKGLANPPKVILITAFREYALEGFELDVVDYLLKPVSQVRFLQALAKFEARVEVKQGQGEAIQAEKEFLVVLADRQHVKVFKKEVLVLESQGDYVCITAARGTVRTKANLGALIQELSDVVIQTHRSFAVNTERITAFTKEEVYIDKHIIPIGRKYKAEVMRVLTGA